MAAKAALHVTRLDIGDAPRLAEVRGPVVIPKETPTPILLLACREDASPDTSSSRAASDSRVVLIDRLLEAVDALVHNEQLPWLIVCDEAHRSEIRSWRDIVRSPQLARFPCVGLVITPHHRTVDSLARELRGQVRLTRAWLKLLGARERPNDAQLPESRVSAPLAAARRRRQQLLNNESWLNPRELHEQQGGARDAAGANNTASRLRRKGEVLGVWDGREYRYPAFQFDPNTGRLMPEVRELLTQLPVDATGWRQAFWLFQPHALLDGRRPADVFSSDPHTVLDAARSTFKAPSERW